MDSTVLPDLYKPHLLYDGSSGCRLKENKAQGNHLILLQTRTHRETEDDVLVAGWFLNGFSFVATKGHYMFLHTCVLLVHFYN